jgi:hypothetical protein
MKKIKTFPYIERNLHQIKNLFTILESSQVNDLIEKYNVDLYVKNLKTIHLLKISLLFYLSREKYLKNFLEGFLKRDILRIIFNLPKTSYQQIYKALKKRCWLFHYTALLTINLELKKKYPKSKLFKNKEMRICDSTTLEFCVKRLYFAQKGYSNSKKKFVDGIKLHLLYNASFDTIEDVIETSANINDSSVADTLIKNIDGGFLLMDKGYFKFERLLDLNKRKVKFVIPIKSNTKYKVLSEIFLDNVVMKKIMFDNGLVVNLVEYEKLKVITNDLSLNWEDIVFLYSCRWQIEVLFKKMKQYFSLGKPLFRNSNSILSFVCVSLICMCLVDFLSYDLGIFLNKLCILLGRSVQACLVCKIEKKEAG